ncbi:MAG: hypothetical protein JXR61_02615 [Prolixibacteraceae bacterium]|nr:hypothetical protein [Prolixibacteraceae bacterium]
MKNQPKLSNLLLSVLAILFVFSFSIPAFAQVATKKLLTKSDSLNLEYPQEKIYLHLDRPSYWAGDDIWFKAYLKNTVIPNCNVYVELLDSAGNVIYKDICWAMNGYAYGDFELGDTLSSGMYQLRAYTSWMRNFDEQWFFRRDLVIWNLRDKERAPEVQKLNARKVNIDFMPESGTFLAGIKNKVAFKATDENGKGLDVEGVIIDDKRYPIAEIKSNFKGMGSFEITPQPGIKYTAEVTIAGNIPKGVYLPVATETGVAMRYNSEDTTQIHFEINASNENTSTYLLTGQTEGKVCYYEEIKITNGKAVLNIRKDNFPTGIVRFTIFDENRLPKCERLVFVDNHDQIAVNITPNKQTFKPREIVTLDLMALGKGNLPVISNLSLSVYPVETTNEIKTYPENIMTSFLLSSELKGRIEEPAYYFKDDSLSTLIALDNLLLTHGYRYFSWEEVIENRQPEITFQPDSSIEIKGQVVSLLFRRPVADGKVTMITLKSLLDINEQTTDEDGNFKFSNLYFYDSLYVAVQALNRNGNKNTDIIWDDKVQQSPKTEIFPSIYLNKNGDETKTVTYMSEMSPELINRKWRLSDTILLQELNVIARKRVDDGYVRPYTSADIIIDIKKMKDKNRELAQLYGASAAIRKVVTESFSGEFMPNGVVYIDGVEDNLGFGPPPLEFIDKIEYIDMYPVLGGYAPAVFYWTIRGRPDLGRTIEPAGIFSVDWVGYTLTRVFYSPVYNETEDLGDKTDDYRSTLYWDPAIETNYKGNAKVSFYNSDQTGEVKVVVEGITYNGKLCRGVGSYSVEY